jgi:hypothetical protein
MVREGVRRILETDPEIELTSCCVDLAGLLAARSFKQPHQWHPYATMTERVRVVLAEDSYHGRRRTGR